MSSTDRSEANQPIHAYVPFSEPADEELASPVAGGLLRRMMVAVNAGVDAELLDYVGARSDCSRRSGAGRRQR